MSDWWRAVEGALERLGDEGPDPWADADVPAAAELTPEQRAFLAQMADTPVHLFDERDLADDGSDGTEDSGSKP
jgi:hypothetical protein